ncbi:MAG: hypothetical protein ACRC2T_20955, partial [Thermoguttaceae bacterium]
PAAPTAAAAANEPASEVLVAELLSDVSSVEPPNGLCAYKPRPIPYDESADEINGEIDTSFLGKP